MARDRYWNMVLVAAITIAGGALAACQQEPSICETPLVLSFNGGAVEYVVDPGDAYFELGQHNNDWTTDWPTAKTPWLARDLDGDGAIGGGNELLGSETLLQDGRKAKSGFEALADLDTDENGRVDESDSAWESILVWRDENADRRSDDSELRTANAAGILWIDLPGTHRSAGRDAGIVLYNPPDPRCDSNGNCEIERSAFGYSDGTEERKGTVVDIHLRAFPRDSLDDGASDETGGEWPSECR